MSDYVFGYGSLVDSGTPATLRGHRRRWGVAMDNSRDLPGYKYYVDERTGERPKVFVTFLEIAPDDGTDVNGALIPVTAADLQALDQRERNYERREVSQHVETDGRVWAYFGTEAARARYEKGVAEGAAVVSRDYVESVRASFTRLGPGELRRFDASTTPPAVPILPLKRVDLSPAS